MKKGVTLVELAIVLVIIGLLVAGTLGGQDLIEQAETRSDISNFESYTTSIGSFNLKYGELPGDFRRATDFWSDCVDIGEFEGIGNSVDATCNGNGNGLIHYGEGVYTFEHMSRAEMVAGDYRAAVAVVGSVPSLKTTGQYVFPAYSSTYSFTSLFFDFPLNLNMFFASKNSDGTIAFALDTLPTPVSSMAVRNLDKKVDDGLAGGGMMRALFTGYVDADTLCANSDGTYKVTTDKLLCPFILAL